MVDFEKTTHFETLLFFVKSFLFLYVFVISYTNLAVHLYWHHILYEETIIYVKPWYHQHVVIIKKKLVIM